MINKRWRHIMLLLCGVCIFFIACSTPECEEKLMEDCLCTLQYDPVCGCNNKTYGNACVAECSNIKVYKKGPCETP